MSSTDTKALWFCHGIGMGLCATRLVLRKYRRQALTAGDYWTVLALVALTLRATLNNMIMRGGTTATMENDLRAPGRLSSDTFDRIVLNSKLNIANRLTISTMLWALKMVVLDLCSRLIRKMPKEHLIKYSFWAVFAATYLAAQLTVALECKPFHLYWQIYPDPGTCVNGNVWLITYEFGNLVTDIMLLVFPFPLLFAVKIHWQKKAQLCALFSIGILLIAISCVRISQGLLHSRSQLSRTLWGSIEALFASIVAQVPTMYTLFRNSTHQNSSYQTPEDTYYLASRTVQATRSNTNPKQGDQSDDVESRHSRFVALNDRCRVHGYAAKSTRPESTEPGGESESTKGILVTVDITQVDESKSRHQVTEISRPSEQ